MKDRLRPALEAALVLAVLVLAGWLRFSDLDRFIASDELRWTCRSINFHAALVEHRWRDTFQVGHPGVITMWLGSAAVPLREVGVWRDLAPTTQGCTEMNALDDIGREDVYRSAAPLLFKARRGVAVATTALLGLLYVLLRIGGIGAAPALGGLVLLAFDPFLLAHSRVIHVDAVASLLALLAVVSLSLARRRSSLPGSRTDAGDSSGSRSDAGGSSRASTGGPTDRPPWRMRWIVLSGLFAGLAMIEKSSSLVLGPATLLWLGWSGWRDGDARGAARRMAVWGLAAAAIAVAVWPAMWVAPIQTVAGVLGKAQEEGGEPHASGNYFLGRPVEDPGPLFYPVAAAFRLTPWGMLGLASVVWMAMAARRAGRRGAGAAIAGGGSTRSSGSEPSAGMTSPAGTTSRTLPTLSSISSLSPLPAHPAIVDLVRTLAAWALLFALVVTLSPKKFDRYLLPGLAAMNLAGGVAIAVLADRWRLPGRAARLSAGRVAIAGLLVLQGAAAVRALPYPLMYYNPLLGGPGVARRAILVGWGEGYDMAAEYLNGLPDAADLEVSVRGVSNFAPLFKGRTRSAEGFRPDRTDYVVLYINQVQRRQDADRLAEYYDGRSPAPAFVGHIGGIEVVRVIPNAARETSTKPQDRLAPTRAAP